MKVNLGCGYRPLKGYVNVDCVANEGVDKVIDLDKYPWDFTDNSVDEVYCDNILEHLDFAKSTKELHRILKKGGKAVIKVPYFSNPGAFFADHQHFYNFDSYNKYCKNIHSGMDISEPFFELESRRITFLDEYKSGLSKIALFIYYLLPKLCYYINPYIYPIFKPYFSRFRTAFCAEEYLAFNRAGVVHTSFLFKHK